jgi:hypothetical protein
MGQNDAMRRHRDAILAILETHGVTNYVEVKKSKSHAIQITYGGRVGTITYSGTGSGSFRGPANTRSMARRVLGELGVPSIVGARRKKDHMSDPPVEAPVEAPDIPEVRDIIDEPTTTIEQEAEHHADTDQQQQQPEEEATTMNEFPDLAALDAAMSDEISYGGNPTTYRARPQNIVRQKAHRPTYRLTTGKFLAVKLTRDLIAEAGTWLVWPEESDGIMMDFTEDQFKAFFAANKPREVVEDGSTFHYAEQVDHGKQARSEVVEEAVAQTEQQPPAEPPIEQQPARGARSVQRSTRIISTRIISNGVRSSRR